MELLKVQVKKDIWEQIESGNTNKLTFKKNQSFMKKIVEEDGVTLKNIDKLYVTCMFSSKNETFDIESISNEDNDIVFEIKNTNIIKEEIETIKDDIEKETIETPIESISKTESIESIKQEKKESKENKPKEVKSVGERVNELLDDLCSNNNTVVVGTPIVIIRPDGYIFGQRKKLPLKNDVVLKIPIESQKLYFTYDISEDEYINQLMTYFKKMVATNFVFLWRKKCVYKEVDGKRYLNLFYTTRKYVNESKKIF